MIIKRTKPEDATTERYIITALILSEEVCRMLHRKYEPAYMQTKLTREVADWCFDFFQKYDTSPKMEITAVFENKTKGGYIDPDLGDEIEVFLESISEEYSESTEFNVKYYSELALEYFKKRSYILLSERLRKAAEEDVTKAEQVYTNFTKVLETQDTSREVYSDKGLDEYKQSVLDAPPELFRMPGALGQMMGPIMRETFIGILGREKVGKTYAMFMFAIMAAKCGLNVAMIETGDMTQDQLDTRFYNYVTRKTNRADKAGTYRVPRLDCLLNQTAQCRKVGGKQIVQPGSDGNQDQFLVDHTDSKVLRKHKPCIDCWKDRQMRKRFKGSVWWQEEEIGVWNWKEAREKSRRFQKYFKGKIVTEAYDMQTVRMSDIRDWLLVKQKRKDGKPFIPHLVLVDYPDITLPENDGEFRHQENTKWMLGKRISQEFHCCVGFPTQADAKSYNIDTLKLSNYSEDKRKYGHVTHFYGYNKTDDEEDMGLARMSTMLLREDSVKMGRQCTILQCLERSQPYIASFIGRAPLPLNRRNDTDE